jgi:hypothetical protein
MDDDALWYVLPGVFAAVPWLLVIVCSSSDRKRAVAAPVQAQAPVGAAAGAAAGHAQPAAGAAAGQAAPGHAGPPAGAAAGAAAAAVQVQPPAGAAAGAMQVQGLRRIFTATAARWSGRGDSGARAGAGPCRSGSRRGTVGAMMICGLGLGLVGHMISAMISLLT